MKFRPYVDYGSEKSWLNFGSDVEHLYILNAVRCPYVRTYSVTLVVASSVANDHIMRMTS